MQEARTGSLLGVSALSRASAIIADSPTGWPDALPRRYWIPERTAGSCCSCCPRAGACAAEITPSTARKTSSERDPVRDMARVLLERNRCGNEDRPVRIDCTAAPADFETSQGRFRRVAAFSGRFRPAFIADFRGAAICLFRTHFLAWSGRFFHGSAGVSPSSACVFHRLMTLGVTQLKTGLNKVMGRNLIPWVSKTCGHRQPDPP